jgi:RNA polymerase sigma-70 factor (ECF subfamily)
LANLARAFQAGAGGGPLSDDALARLDERLRACVEAARAAWPAVTVADERFAAQLGACAASEEGLAALHANDLYLACACLESQPEALAAFDAAFMAQLDTHLRRYDPSPGFADEVRQILRERFFVWVDGKPPRIAGYGGRGALGAWVRVAAVRVALRLARSGAQRPTMESAISPDPELEYVRARYRGAFARALADALGVLPTEERNLLRLHFVDGLTIDGLAPMFRVHRATAARRLADARDRLLSATRSRLETTLGVSGRELESLIGLLRSRIEIDLSSLFRSPEEKRR